MSDNSDNNEVDDKQNLDNFLNEWPVMDTLDFDLVTVDVTKWEDGNYTASLNFYVPKENGEPPHSGFSLCTQIGGSTLYEVHQNLSALMSSGFLDGVNISAIGTIWDENANEVGQIDWTDYDEDEEDESDDQESGAAQTDDDFATTDYPKNRVLH